MKELEETLGRTISVKELANYLNISEKIIRENYQQLGGVRIGRHYRFFERRIIDALEKREEIYSASQKERETERESISDPERGKDMGIRNEKNARRGMERDDRHGLLD